MTDAEDPHTPDDGYDGYDGWNRPNRIETDSYGRRWEVDVDGRRRALDPPTTVQRVRACTCCIAAVAMLVALIIAVVRAVA